MICVGWGCKVEESKSILLAGADGLWAASCLSNILAVREMIEEDRCLTIREIAAHVWTSCGSAQWIISDDLGSLKVHLSSPLDARSESNRLAVRERLGTISNRRMISRGTLSSVMRRGCIITSRSPSTQAGVAKIYRSSRKTKLVFLLGKFLRHLLEIAETYYALIFSVNDVQSMLRTTANCLMKWNWPIDEKSDICPLIVVRVTKSEGKLREYYLSPEVIKVHLLKISLLTNQTLYELKDVIKW